MVTLIVARLVLGKEGREEVGEQLAELYHTLELSAATPSTIGLPFLILWPTVARGYFARKKVCSIIEKYILKQRKKGGAPHEPSYYLTSCMPPNAVASAVAFVSYQMMFVSHTNTAGTMAWGIAHLSQNQAYLKQVQQEIASVELPNFTTETFSKLPITHRAVFETIRVVQGALFSRIVVCDDLVIDGYHIPKNSMVSTYPRFFHENPDIFPDPMKFNPDRFIDKSVEKQLSCNLFGHGLHVCLGKQLATKIVLLCWHTLFSKYNLDVELPNGMPHPDWQCMSGIPVEGSSEVMFKLSPKTKL